jgi:hypothetical protein
MLTSTLVVSELLLVRRFDAPTLLFALPEMPLPLSNLLLPWVPSVSSMSSLARFRRTIPQCCGISSPGVDAMHYQFAYDTS